MRGVDAGAALRPGRADRAVRAVRVGAAGRVVRAGRPTPKTAWAPSRSTPPRSGRRRSRCARRARPKGKQIDSPVPNDGVQASEEQSGPHKVATLWLRYRGGCMTVEYSPRSGRPSISCSSAVAQGTDALPADVVRLIDRARLDTRPRERTDGRRRPADPCLTFRTVRATSFGRRRRQRRPSRPRGGHARRPEVDARPRTRVMRAVNHAPDAAYRPVYVVMQLGSLGGGLAAGALLARRDRRTGIATMVAVTAAWGGSKLVKRSTGRGRPDAHLDEIVIRGAPQRGLGFPSGHAGVATVVALSAACRCCRAPRRSRSAVPRSPRWSRACTSARTCRSTSPAAPRWASPSGAPRATGGALTLDLMSTLILLRHGQSEWNLANRFTGWVDVDLTELGEQEAMTGGELMLAEGLAPAVLHTSLQKRAIRTAELALRVMDRQWIPVRRSWRLNERHYGGPPGARQEGDRRRVRRRAGEGLAARLRHAAAPLDDDAVRRAGRGSALRRPPADLLPAHGVPRRRRRADDAVLVRRHRPRPRAAGQPCSWPPTATRCGPW